MSNQAQADTLGTDAAAQAPTAVPAAEAASPAVDLRSLDPAQLEELTRQVLAAPPAPAAEPAAPSPEVPAEHAPVEQPAATPEVTPEAPAPPAPELDDDDADKGKRVRLRVSDPVEQRAIELKQRNHDLSLEECLQRARAELQPEAATAQPSASEQPAVRSLSEIDAEIQSSEQAFLEAGNALNFEDQTKLQIKLRALDREREQARQAQEREHRSHEQRYQDALTQTVEKFPSSVQADSPLTKAMAVLREQWEKNGDVRYTKPDMPLLLAQAAQDLLNATAPPVRPAAVQAAAPVATPAPRAAAAGLPASGSARSTTSAPAPAAESFAAARSLPLHEVEALKQGWLRGGSAA